MTVVYKPTTGYSKIADTTIQKKDFFTDLVINGQRIVTYTQQSGIHINLIYTIPDGKVYFITNIVLSLENSSALVTSNMALLINDATGYFFVEVAPLSGQTHTNYSFPLPFKMSSKEKIYLQTSSSANVNISIIGYLIDQSMLKEFN